MPTKRSRGRITLVRGRHEHGNYRKLTLLCVRVHHIAASGDDAAGSGDEDDAYDPPSSDDEEEEDSDIERQVRGVID